MEVLKEYTDGCLLFQNTAQVLKAALSKSKAYLLSSFLKYADAWPTD
jgi:hypothetical protein